MKKTISFLLCGLLLLSLTACGGKDAQGNSNDDTLAASPEAGTVNGYEKPTDNAGDDGEDTRERAEDSGRAEAPSENEATGPSAESSILIAYYSLSDEQYEVGVIEKGNTQIVAEIIADQTGADTFSIESTVAYPTTYDGLLEVSREEENNPPEIAGTVENMDDYEIIFIGYAGGIM
ncbi:MAG: hypothetical protein HDR04_19475 [Lachnospiraceae bacterium]|nr:hypothetical protein [Lachnospiraceae bacterium]